MSGKKHSLIVLLALVLALCLTVTVNAQASLGSLTVGQPVIAQISAEAPVAQFDYAAEEAQIIAVQVFGETLQPTITVLRDGAVIAQNANAAGELIVTLEAVLSPGNTIIEIGAANGSAGTGVLVVQSANPIPVTELAAGVAVTGEASRENALALYHVTAAPEASYIFVESGIATSGVVVRLMNEASGQQSGMLAADLLGGRFNIPANSAFRVEVEHSGADQAEPYTLCWANTAEGCGSAPAATTEEAAPVVQEAACTVTPNASAVNVRASASTSSAIIATLPAGVSAQVLGIGPGNFFYNIQLGGVNGWVSASVVTANGQCANLPVVQPPQFTPIATQPPAATPAPAQPTQPPAQPTQPPAQPPASQPTPEPSGPCLLTVNSPTNVYTIPNAIIDNLQDQVGAGGQLIPTGRLADNSWWQTNYGGAWIQTGLFGGSVTVSGNCNLPVVSAPQPQQPATCLLSVVGNTNVYTAPQAGNAYLMSVVAPGGELIVTGRLSGNDWYKTNYGGGWVQASIIGNGLEVASGNCGNVPVVSP
jgi:uncharacterized protein YraI